MEATASDQVTPGWYPDPLGGGERYWDGQQWKEDTRAGGRPPQARDGLPIWQLVAVASVVFALIQDLKPGGFFDQGAVAATSIALYGAILVAAAMSAYRKDVRWSLALAALAPAMAGWMALILPLDFAVADADVPVEVWLALIAAALGVAAGVGLSLSDPEVRRLSWDVRSGEFNGGAAACAAGGAILFVALFLPNYLWTDGVEYSGWEFWFGTIDIFQAVLGVAIAGVAVACLSSSRAGLPWALVVLGAITVFFILTPADFGDVGYELKVGYWLAYLGAAMALVGGLVAWRTASCRRAGGSRLASSDQARGGRRSQ